MPNPYNGSRRGKRGGNKWNKDARREAESRCLSHGSTSEVIAEGKGGYTPAMYECASGMEETKEDHIIPRRSLTRTQHLKLFKQSLEFEPLKDTHRVVTGSNIGINRSYKVNYRDKDGNKVSEYMTAKGCVDVYDKRAHLAWKSDRTLLKGGKPEATIGQVLPGTAGAHGFKRVTSRSKRRINIIEDHTPTADQE